MTYLLDVNALLALGDRGHVHHERAERWAFQVQRETCDPPLFATCAITELGFVRIATGGAGFVTDIQVAKQLLRRLKVGRQFTFLGDELGAERLPRWVVRSRQTTDGHLLELARANAAILATLDTRIPGALLIPELSIGDLGVEEPVASYNTAA